MLSSSYSYTPWPQLKLCKPFWPIFSSVYQINVSALALYLKSISTSKLPHVFYFQTCNLTKLIILPLKDTSIRCMARKSNQNIQTLAKLTIWHFDKANNKPCGLISLVFLDLGFLNQTENLIHSMFIKMLVWLLRIQEWNKKTDLEWPYYILLEIWNYCYKH